jgi:ribosome-binding ATPase YchF (GTP1/OBG family)
MTTKQQYTIEELKRFCDERGIILVDAQDYGRAIPVMLTRRQVSWGYVERHIELGKVQDGKN